MNRWIKIGAILVMAGCLSACGGGDSDVSILVDAQISAANTDEDNTGEAEAPTTADGQEPRSNGSGSELTDNVAGRTSAADENAAASEENNGFSADPNVDVDLTAMSGTMVYAEVYNLMMDPEAYEGKTIKIRGPYYASYWDTTDKYYHYVIVEDAAACCSQGLEFIWDHNEHAFPDSYPEDYTDVELVGTFKFYEEEGMTFGYLETDDLIVMN